MDEVKDVFDVEVYDFGKGWVGVSVDVFVLCGVGVGEEDVDVVGVFFYLFDEVGDVGLGGVVGWYRDGFGVGGEVGEGVEGGDGGFVGGGFVWGDEDEGGVGLEDVNGGC